MFTKNFQAYMHNVFFGFYNANHNSYLGYAGKNYVDYTGASAKMYSNEQAYNAGFGRAMGKPTIGEISKNYGIFFGTGPTPATEDDYTLESPITSGVEVVYTSVTTTKEADGRYSVCGQYTLKNTGVEPINIYEIGVFGVVRTSTNASYDTSVLMERTVLSVPITIGRDEMKLVTYKLTFNQMLNVEE